MAVLEKENLIKASKEASFLVESKSMTSKMYMSNSSEKEFEVLKQLIGAEVKGLIFNRQIGLYEKINPIVDRDVENIKRDLINLIAGIESVGSKNICKRISQCLTARELFNVSKSLVLNFVQSTFENKDVIKEIVQLFSPKTPRPDVFKIEEEVRKMGVSYVNFANDLEQANLVKEAVADLMRAKIPLPESIVVTPIMPMGTSVYSAGHHIYLQTSCESEFEDFLKKGIVELASHTNAFKNATAVNKNKYVNSFENSVEKFFSTRNPKHKIYHEVAHLFCAISPELLTKKLSDEEIEIARSVSKCAANSVNGSEIVPEMFAMLMDGQKLTDEQMELYLKLGKLMPRV